MYSQKLHRSTQTILSRILQLLILFVLVPLAILLIVYNLSTQNALKEEVFQTHVQTLETKSNSIEKMIDQMLSASNLIGLDKRINEITGQYDNWKNDAYIRNQLIQEVVSKLTDVKNYILPGEGEITLIDTRGIIYSTASLTDSKSIAQIQDLDWYRNTVEANGYVYWFASPRNADFAEKHESYLSMARMLKFGSVNDHQLILLFQLRTSAFLSAQEIQQDFGNLYYVLAENGTVFISNDRSMIGQQLPSELLQASQDRRETEVQFKGQPGYFMGYKLPNFNWKLTMYYDQSVLRERLAKAQSNLFLIAGLFAALFIVLISLFSLLITKPLSRLTHSIQALDSGNLDIRVRLSGPFEVKFLTQQFNQMVRRLGESIERNKEERKKKEAALFQAQQAQINPHFLFNTLNTIKWTAYMSGASHVAEMVSRLGRLLEITFQHQEDLVTVREELEHLQLYMDLQNMRFNNNYTLRLELPEMSKELLVPKLTLQPIVENSIRHGFKDGAAQGEIRLRGRAEGNDFLLSVEDNGAGITPERMKMLQFDRPDQPGESQISGIGLKNVHDRIQWHYGPEYGLRIASQLDEGTTVTIRLPMKGATLEHA
ncbi:sensor histidine kinase [Paenibacillus thalictri]|uniref:histidine kinase n=1 Tax=Paenibacillus thalictri TaxID=2527873 RepID=A0A4Q9DUX8_9BACL|nr:sensor histidine kinase [Paenibacillus thalictri]TBL80827.1 HAMP domain-containing protein [Paenibacillus thalictri]